LLTLVLALINLSYRYRSEVENRAVGLAVEGGVLSDVAAAAGEPVTTVLTRLKPNGLTAVILQEQTLGELLDAGALTLANDGTWIIIEGPSYDLDRVEAAIEVALRSPLAAVRQSDTRLAVSIPGGSLRSLSLGIDPVMARESTEAGLLVIARHGNRLGMNIDYLSWLLQTSATRGAGYLLPSGDQVMGNRPLLPETAELLSEFNILYVTPEFVKIAGDAQMVQRMTDRTIRLHSIQQAEIDRMSHGAVYERYVKAFRERNIRWLLVRPLTVASDDPVAELGSTLEGLTRRLAKEGGVVRAPRPFADPNRPAVLALALAVVAVPVALWVAWQILGGGAWGKAAAVVAVGAALAAWLPDYRWLFAFLAALAFPLGGYLLIDESKPGIWGRYAAISGASLLGGLVVAGLLVGTQFMLQADQFAGVKAAQFLPIAVVAWLLLRKITDIRAAMSQPVLWGSALLAIVGLAALLFMMGRSGNENPAAVSGLELKFRSLLDQFLYTRPRTKEFLIGHPALVVGLALLGSGTGREKGLAFALLAVGMIGQMSIVNTMCHLHSPLDLSLARIGIGLVLGGIIGAVVWVVFRGTLVRQKGNS